MIPLIRGAGKSRLVLGLMSGTSHDGVDAALARISGSGTTTRVRLLHHAHLRYGPALRNSVRAAFSGSAQDICRLNFRLGEVFASAALKCAREAGVSMKRVYAIASHGQTICHIPPGKGRRGSTLQIGESAVIARMTGVPVVSDFRVADMAAGGHGAPLVPFADYVLFKGKAVRAVQNIGGIANVTVVTPSIEDLYAFDTGPGNSLMDEAMTALFGSSFDRGGKVAGRGKADPEMMARLMAHPYLAKRPPKSTGRETFGSALLEELLAARRMRAEDVLATLTLFTAESIADAYRRFVFPRHRVSEVIVSGGGTRNLVLMRLIRERLAPLKVKSIEEMGIPSAAKEALSFAVLANETIMGGSACLPRVTGALEPVTLGKITLP